MVVVKHGLHKKVRILLVGDSGVGKTSLILSLVSEEFPEDVPPKSEEIIIPPEVTPEMVPTHIVDFSAVEQTDDQLVDEVKRANVICVVYSVQDEETMDRITSYWLPLIRDTVRGATLHQRTPVVLVGNKVDLVDYSTVEAALDIMNEYKEVESFVECSAKTLNNISEMFYYAQKAVLHPTGPLFVPESQDLTESCKKALTRIFKICDLDNDGLLNDVELNYFQKRCFDTQLRSEALDDIKALLRVNISDGVSPTDCITLSGFLFLHCLFMQRGRSHTTWAVLRTFGYNDHLRMDRSYIHPKVHVPAGSTVELNVVGQQFLSGLFDRFDQDRDGALSPFEQERLFALCPAPAWGSEIKDQVSTNQQGWITAEGFICFWVLTTLRDPKTTLEYLAHFGYPITDTENQTSAIQVTRDKSLDLLKKQSTRNVYECHVVGSKGSGKTTICRSLITTTGRRHHLNLKSPPPQRTPASHQGCSNGLTVGSVSVYGQEKWLVMREIDVDLDADADDVRSSWSCDVACLVYDPSNCYSFPFICSVYQRFFSDNRVPVLVVSNNKSSSSLSVSVGSTGSGLLAEVNAFCEDNCLAPPHSFSPSLQQSKEELLVKLTTMSAFPHWKEMNLLSGDSPMLWKAGLGITLVAALSFILVRLITR